MSTYVRPQRTKVLGSGPQCIYRKHPVESYREYQQKLQCLGAMLSNLLVESGYL